MNRVLLLSLISALAAEARRSKWPHAEPLPGSCAKRENGVVVKVGCKSSKYSSAEQTFFPTSFSVDGKKGKGECSCDPGCQMRYSENSVTEGIGYRKLQCCEDAAEVCDEIPEFQCTAADRAQRLRREFRQMSWMEKKFALAGFNALKAAPVDDTARDEPRYTNMFDRYGVLHASTRITNTFAHFTSAFLPWHRSFITHLEDDIRALGVRTVDGVEYDFSCWTLPYHDNSMDIGTEFGGKGTFDRVMWQNKPWALGEPYPTFANGTLRNLQQDLQDQAQWTAANNAVAEQNNNKSHCCPGAAHCQSIPNSYYEVHTGAFKGWEVSPEARNSRSPPGYGDVGLVRFTSQRTNDWDGGYENRKTSFEHYIKGFPYWGVDGFISRTNASDFLEGGFTNAVEEGTVHVGPHSKVNGWMFTPHTPQDPFFFMLHAGLDKLWAMWQVCYGHDSVDASTPDEEVYRSTAYYMDGQGLRNGTQGCRAHTAPLNMFPDQGDRASAPLQWDDTITDWGSSVTIKDTFDLRGMNYSTECLVQQKCAPVRYSINQFNRAHSRKHVNSPYAQECKFGGSKTGVFGQREWFKEIVPKLSAMLAETPDAADVDQTQPAQPPAPPAPTPFCPAAVRIPRPPPPDCTEEYGGKRIVHNQYLEEYVNNKN